MLVGLDISSAFDTIDHSILLRWLHDELGVTGTALAWFQSYISNRSQFVKLGRHSSAPMSCTSGVPQGSVLGPILFAAYTSPIGDLIRRFGIHHHQFADDTQVHLALRSSDIQNGLTLQADCSAAVKQWYLSRKWTPAQCQQIGSHLPRYIISTTRCYRYCHRCRYYIACQ